MCAVLLHTSKLYSLSIPVRETPLSTIPSICTAVTTEAWKELLGISNYYNTDYKSISTSIQFKGLLKKINIYTRKQVPAQTVDRNSICPIILFVICTVFIETTL